MFILNYKILRNVLCCTVFLFLRNSLYMLTITYNTNYNMLLKMLQKYKMKKTKVIHFLIMCIPNKLSVPIDKGNRYIHLNVFFRVCLVML